MNLRRRELLAALALVGCGEENEMQKAPSPIVSSPPWHMWGGSATVQITSVGPSSPRIPISSQQLANIEYHRPESWGFLCSAKLLKVEPQPVPPGGLIEVNFQVQLGVGRAVIILPALVSFDFAPDTDVGTQRYAAQAIAPPRFNGDTEVTKFDLLTAQSIKAIADVFYVQSPAPGPFTATIEFAMHFAPRTHVRPEWYHGEFDGGELRGR